MPEQSTMSIAEILVGERSRKDMGDIDALAASIEAVGLLQPVVVLKGGILVAGQRRVEAFKKLKRGVIPVYVVKDIDDAQDLLRAERDENTCRKDFTPSEAVAMGKRLEPLEKDAAKLRMKSGSNQYSEPSEKVPEGSKGDTREKIGAAVGMSGPTYQRAKAVVNAAESEPEKYGDLPAKMDAEGNIKGTYDELVTRRGQPKNGKTANTRNLPTRSPEKKAQSFRNALGTLIGLSSSLNELDAKDANLTADEAKNFDDELVAVVAAIRRLRRQLTEVANVH